MIDIYITHYVTDELPGYNDIVVDCVLDLEEATRDDHVDYKVIVLYWTNSPACEADLRTRLPRHVELVRGLNGMQPYLMNLATRMAKARGPEFFLCLHNDLRFSKGWLRNVIADARYAENLHGRGNVVLSPRYAPYHWLMPHRVAYQHPEFWARIQPPVETKVVTVEAMNAWCLQHSIEFDGRRIVCRPSSFVTDDGHQLMMYCAAPSFFDGIGGCDESFAGLNYGDCDWGIRALQAGKKNLISQGCLLGHISGLTFFNPKVSEKLDSNHERFIAKWGIEIWRELQDGSVWTWLHKAQRDAEIR